MRLLSLNVWSGQLLDQLLDCLVGVDADILCLQEMLDARASLTAEVCNVPGARADLYQEIATLLPEYRGVFCSSSQVLPTDPGLGRLADLPIRYSIATFVREDIPVVRQRIDFVHKSFEVIPRGDPPLPRIAHTFTVWDAANGCEVGIAHMHGLWTDTHGKRDIPERTVQARRFADLLYLPPSSKSIACGDWNVLPGSETLEVLENVGLRDLVTRRGFTDTRTSYYKKLIRYADYMCVSSNVEVKSFDVLATPEVSDHRPLLLDFA